MRWVLNASFFIQPVLSRFLSPLIWKMLFTRDGWCSFESKQQSHVVHQRHTQHSVKLLLQFAWRKCLISLVTHLMTLSHLVSTGRTVFLSYWKVTKIWGIFVCEVTNVCPICFFQLRWFNFCNFVLSLHFPLYCLFYLTSFKPTEKCPNMQWP